MPGRWQAALLGSVVAAIAAWAPAAGAAPATSPTWADEFDGTSLDASRWSHRATGIRNDGFLTPDAVSVGEGVLTIKTYTAATRHNSGMISTFDDGTTGFEQRYGHFEARVRFNSSPGQWSAFWLQSPTIGNPLGDPQTAGVEMDVVEHRRCLPSPSPATCAVDASDRVQQALVWDGYALGTSKAAVNLSDPLTGLGNGSWHTWALRWTPTDLTFFYDDVPTWSISGPISRRAQYIILSSEVDDAFAGPIPEGGYGTRATSTTSMEVDYVRVWDATAPVNTAAPVASGTPEVGQALACSMGSWSGDPAPSFGYEWRRDGAAIAGASAPAYSVRSADRGHALSCRVTATSSAGAAAALSNALLVPPPPPPPPPVPPPPPAPVPRTAVDTIAPTARLSGRTTQLAGPRVAVTIACLDEACRATVSGTVRVPTIGRFRAQTYRPRAITTTIAKGARATVRLRLPKARRATIRRALRARRRIVVRLAVRVADGAGNSRLLTRQVALKL